MNIIPDDNLKLYIDRYEPGILSNETSIVQIGAFDGYFQDPIWPILEEYQCSLVSCEPLKELAVKFKKAHKDHLNTKLDVVAVGDYDGKITLYVPNEKWPQIAHKSVSSFQPTGMQKWLKTRGLIKYVGEREVEIITLQNFFNRNNIQNIDIFVVDAEGMDARIVMQLPCGRKMPKIIYYEWHNLQYYELYDLERFLVGKWKYKIITVDDKNKIATLKNEFRK